MNKQQLANKIWASANKMRSKIDASVGEQWQIRYCSISFMCLVCAPFRRIMQLVIPNSYVIKKAVRTREETFLSR